MDTSSELRRIFNLTSNDQLEQKEEKFGESGFLSFRRHVTVRRSTDTEPIRVFLKLSDTSRTELGDMQDASNHLCRNECIFYSIMVPILDKVFSRCQLPSPYPVTFGQRFNSSGSILVMEDLSEQGYYLPKKMLSLAEAQSAVDALARVQAAYWIVRTDMDYSIDDAIFGYKSPFCNQIQQAAKSGKIELKLLLERRSKYLLENLTSFECDKDDQQVISDGIKRLLPLILATYKGEKSFSHSLPAGLNHGDYWLSNFLFKDDGGSLTCKMIDWQGWAINPICNDLGKLFLSSLPNEILKKEMNNLFDRFYSTFKETFESGSGIPAPISYEDMRSSFVTAMFSAVSWGTFGIKIVMMTGVLPVENVLKNLAHILRDVLVDEEIQLQ